MLDRDGVINADAGWLQSRQELPVYPFSARAIRMLNESGWLVVLITNQLAVARGLCTAEDVDWVHDQMREQLARENARGDGIYYCPHHPEFGDDRSCDCRKPATG